MLPYLATLVSHLKITKDLSFNLKIVAFLFQCSPKARKERQKLIESLSLPFKLFSDIKAKSFKRTARTFVEDDRNSKEDLKLKSQEGFLDFNDDSLNFQTNDAEYRISYSSVINFQWRKEEEKTVLEIETSKSIRSIESREPFKVTFWISEDSKTKSIEKVFKKHSVLKLDTLNYHKTLCQVPAPFSKIHRKSSVAIFVPSNLTNKPTERSETEKIVEIQNTIERNANEINFEKKQAKEQEKNIDRNMFLPQERIISMTTPESKSPKEFDLYIELPPPQVLTTTQSMKVKRKNLKDFQDVDEIGETFEKKQKCQSPRFRDIQTQQPAKNVKFFPCTNFSHTILSDRDDRGYATKKYLPSSEYKNSKQFESHSQTAKIKQAPMSTSTSSSKPILTFLTTALATADIKIKSDNERRQVFLESQQNQNAIHRQIMSLHEKTSDSNKDQSIEIQTQNKHAVPNMGNVFSRVGLMMDLKIKKRGEEVSSYAELCFSDIENSVFDTISQQFVRSRKLIQMYANRNNQDDEDSLDFD
ncbi:hypothetical protein HK096_004017 [Nowakowskiella sp. JEL0078]|nr:hypothetical protein HK096_004017 [Nowakowskiella sp. JEL0078]